LSRRTCFFGRFSPGLGIEGLAQALAGLLKPDHSRRFDCAPPSFMNTCIAFDVAPNILGQPYVMTGLNDGSVLMKKYFSVAWYSVQIVLNAGNYPDGGFKTDIRPMDWPYCYVPATLGFTRH
jgi:hypothetical protein